MSVPTANMMWNVTLTNKGGRITAMDTHDVTVRTAPNSRQLTPPPIRRALRTNWAPGRQHRRPGPNQTHCLPFLGRRHRASRAVPPLLLTLPAPAPPCPAPHLSLQATVTPTASKHVFTIDKMLLPGERLLLLLLLLGFSCLPCPRTV